MTNRTSLVHAALPALSLLTLSLDASASSHREAPSIASDPAADNTDLYAWVEGSNLIVIADFIPLEEPSAGPNFYRFSDDVLYEIHIARGPSSLEDVLTYQIRFSTTYKGYVDPGAGTPTPADGNEFFSQLSGGEQTYSVTKLTPMKSTVLVTKGNVAPPNIGPRTNQLAYNMLPAGTTYEQWFIGGGNNVIQDLGPGEGRAFAGPRDDPFYADLGAISDLAGLRTIVGGTPVDGLAGYNTHTIALEIPLTVVNGGPVKPGPSDTQTIGVWASASRRKTTIMRTDRDPDAFGPFQQVSRVGLPLINEVLIGLQDKDRWNRLRPKDDLKYFSAYFLNPMIVRDAEFAGFYSVGGPLNMPCAPDAAALLALKTNRGDITDVINLKLIPGHNISSIGDVLRVDLGMSSGFPNGRRIVAGTNKEEADVTDVALNLLLCKQQMPASFAWDGVNYNDATFRQTFPFLAPPWEGFGQGHGKPTP